MAALNLTVNKDNYGFDPRTIGGVMMWLDAGDSNFISFSSGSNVLRWRDKSGNSNDMVFSSGTVTYTTATTGLSGSLLYPAISLSQNALMTSASNMAFVSNTTTVFLAARVTGGSNGAAAYLTIPALNSGDYALRAGLNADGTTTFFLQENSAGSWGATGGGGSNSATNYIVNGTPIATYNPNLSNVTLIINSPIQSNVTSQMTLGSTAFNRGMSGFFYEVLLYSNQPTTAQRRMIEGYLANKWGIPGNQTTPTFDPRSIGNCIAWYDAADASTIIGNPNVTAWTDKSSNASRLVTSGTIPVFNFAGYDMLSFTSLGTMTSSNSFSFSSNTTCVFVAFYGISNATIQMIYALPGVSIGGNAGDYSIRYLSTGLLNANGIGDIGWNGSASTYIINGVAQTTSNAIVTQGLNVVYTPFNSNVTSTFSISSSLFSRYFRGLMCEVLMYSALPSTSNRQSIESYLFNKWGFQSGGATTGLRTLHPHYRRIPRSIATFSPLSISNCALWLDAADVTTFSFSSGTTISQWRDKTPTGAIGTPSTGASGLVPSRVSNTVYIYNNNSSTYNSSTFTCLQFNKVPVTAAQTTLFAVFRLTSSTNLDALVKITSPTDHYRIFGQVTVYEGNRSLAMTSFSSNTTLLTRWVSQNSSSAVSLNGVAYASNTTTVTLGTYGGGAFFIGGGGILDNRFFNGFISEVIWYNSVLSTSELQQLEGYLANKWGLKTNIPATHPFKTLLPPATAFVPSALTTATVSMWWDGRDPNFNYANVPANGSILTTWVDKAGNRLTGTGVNSPVYSQVNKAVTFSSGPKPYYTTQLSASASSETIFIVAQNFGIATHTLLGTSSANGRVLRTNSGSIQMLGGTGGTYTAVGASVSIGVTYMITCQYNSSASGVTIRFNGNTTTIANTTAVALTASLTTLVGVDAGVTNPMDGYIYEIISFSGSVLSLTDIQLIEGYLAWKWNLNSLLPTTHLYYKIKP